MTEGGRGVQKLENSNYVICECSLRMVPRPAGADKLELLVGAVVERGALQRGVLETVLFLRFSKFSQFFAPSARIIHLKIFRAFGAVYLL